ncbi:RNA polymerase sigma factor [Rufibacter roseus]|uniref:RNA polymerase sigma factor n=1 Tax=Rufibacter roseus TaxID=1567108 RepID=A0ABW2DLK3_9BACT|nr:sigma-70 family RNA polymerase sigma factor [Rufibacter roseus]
MPHQPSETFSEHLFRETYGEVFSVLFRKYGPAHQSDLEDALQDAFYTALKTWPLSGSPDNPKAWLLQVTQNKLLNTLKQAGRRARPLSCASAEAMFEQATEPDTEDSQLRLLFALCQPTLSPSAQIMFALKYLGGFGVQEIAQGLQQSKEAVYKSLQRSKSFFQQLPPHFLEVPVQHNAQRLPWVLKSIYLLFNEGYDTASGNSLLNHDICLEAVRLTKLLVNPFGEQAPEVHHLLALLYFQCARFAARTQSDGAFVPLSEQDRNLWDRKLMTLGFRHLHQTFPAQGNAYYTQACIAGLHLTAPTYAQTDWAGILRLYNILVQQEPSSFVVQINRAVALAHCQGPTSAIALLQQLPQEAHNYYLYHTALAHLYTQTGQLTEATACYQKALALPLSPAHQKVIQNKLAALAPAVVKPEPTSVPIFLP